MAVSYGQASGAASDVEVLPLILKTARVSGGFLFVYVEDPQEMQGRPAELGSAFRDPKIKHENRNVAVLHFASPCYISRSN
jgi:hypothetical protein